MIPGYSTRSGRALGNPGSNCGPGVLGHTALWLPDHGDPRTVPNREGRLRPWPALFPVPPTRETASTALGER